MSGDWRDNPDMPDCAASGDDPCSGYQRLETKHAEEVRDLKAMIARLSVDVAAAEKWAADYQRQHGPFAREPREPDFMIVF